MPSTSADPLLSKTLSFNSLGALPLSVSVCVYVCVYVWAVVAPCHSPSEMWAHRHQRSAPPPLSGSPFPQLGAPQGGGSSARSRGGFPGAPLPDNAGHSMSMNPSINPGMNPNVNASSRSMSNPNSMHVLGPDRGGPLSPGLAWHARGVPGPMGGGPGGGPGARGGARAGGIGMDHLVPDGAHPVHRPPGGVIGSGRHMGTGALGLGHQHGGVGGGVSGAMGGGGGAGGVGGGGENWRWQAESPGLVRRYQGHAGAEGHARDGGLSGMERRWDPTSPQRPHNALSEQEGDTQGGHSRSHSRALDSHSLLPPHRPPGMHPQGMGVQGDPHFGPPGAGPSAAAACPANPLLSLSASLAGDASWRHAAGIHGPPHGGRSGVPPLGVPQVREPLARIPNTFCGLDAPRDHLI